METHLPSPKGAQPPNFWPISVAAKWIKMPLGMELGLGPSDFVLDGDPAPPPQKGVEPPKFSAHVYCVKTAGWIKMVLGVEVGLSPGDFVLDRDPAPSQKGGGAPSHIFGPFLLWPNGWMHHDATWYGGRPRPRGLCVRWEPIPLPKKGAEPLPNFRSMSIAVKGLHGSTCHMVQRYALAQTTLC